MFNHTEERTVSEKGKHGLERVVKWGMCVVASFLETEGGGGQTLVVERGDETQTLSTCACFLISDLTSLLQELHHEWLIVASLTFHFVLQCASCASFFSSHKQPRPSPP